MGKKIGELGIYDLNLKTILEEYDIDREGINNLINEHNLRVKFTSGIMYMQSEQIKKYIKLKPIEEPVEVIEVIPEEEVVITEDTNIVTIEPVEVIVEPVEVIVEPEGE